MQTPAFFVLDWRAISRMMLYWLYGALDMKSLFAFGFAFALNLSGSFADELRLSGGKNWLAIASTNDKDQAIGIARHLKSDSNGMRVVRSVNGYYAVVAGPYQAKTMAKFITSEAGKNFGLLPKDALLSGGARYVETVWEQAKDSSVALQSYTLDKPAVLTSEKLSVRVSGEKLGTENAYTKIEGHDDKGNFTLDIDKDLPTEQLETQDAMHSEYYHRAGVVKLAAGADTKQVVATQYSGGAHCCTTTYIAARGSNAEAWRLIKSEERDGEGFSFEDVDGDGVSELLSIDNAFLYAFESYAGSNAPIQIFQLREGKLVDVSTDPAMHTRLVQDLAGMEWDAKVQPEVAKNNGYLAGWVAAKIRLGQGDEAWRVFMRDYDRKSEVGPQECLTGQKIDECPEDKLKLIPMPRALAKFLKANGYGPLPKDAEAELK